MFDPAAQPWQPAGAGLPALAGNSLTGEFLRRALAAPPAGWQPDPLWEADLRAAPSRPPLEAAVLIAVITDEASQMREHPASPTVILTQRAAHLSTHAGQVSFPGGRQEDRDADATATALRETAEEIGLAAQHIDVLGRLPVYPTVSGYRVTPVVGLVRPGFTLNPDAQEVSAVFDVPLAVLLDPAQHRLHQVRGADGQRRHFYSIAWREHFIWGATAAMLRNLYHWLRAAQNNAPKPC